MKPLPAGPILSGEGFTLRPPCREEVAVYATWWADPEVQWGFCTEARTAESLAAAFPELEQEAADTGHWIDFVLQGTQELLGAIWLSHWNLEAQTADLNVLIAGEQRGRGLARRAIRTLCAWAFPAMELSRISLYPREDHFPAHACYLHAGARRGAIDPEPVEWRGETVFFREFYFLPEDFSPLSEETTHSR